MEADAMLQFPEAQRQAKRLSSEGLANSVATGIDGRQSFQVANVTISPLSTAPAMAADVAGPDLVCHERALSWTDNWQNQGSSLDHVMKSQQNTACCQIQPDVSPRSGLPFMSLLDMCASDALSWSFQHPVCGHDQANCCQSLPNHGLSPPPTSPPAPRISSHLSVLLDDILLEAAQL